MHPHRLLAGALLAAATLVAHAAPKEWTVTELPALGPYGAWARSINNHGDAAGTSGVAAHFPQPVMWRDGVATDLSPGNANSGVANAINDRGEVAGMDGTAVTVWKDGVAFALGLTGEPQDINKSGAVVGYHYPCGVYAGCAQRAFYYKDGVVHDLATLGNSPTSANGLNDRGVVVGYSTLPFSSTSHAVVWVGGVLRDLGTLGGENSSASDVNNRGVILGTADAPDGITHMVTWDVNGGLLRDYGPRRSGHAINDRGAIVGSHLDTGRPFLLEDGVFTWLLDLPAMRAQGWTSFGAWDINEHGWIVGLGYRPGGPMEGTALLLKPR